MTPTLAQLGGFLTVPWLAAAGAAAVSVPVLIHLLWRMRRRREPWGAMRFLIEAYRKHRQRMRLEQWLLLMVRCLILALLGLALAGPVVSGLGAWTAWLAGTDARGHALHIILDDALSTATEQVDGRHRIDDLRDLAAHAIDDAPPGTQIVVWRGSRPAEQLIAGEAGEPALRDAVDDLQPRAGRSDLPTALEAVADWLEREQPGRADILLASDFPRGADYLDDALPGAAQALDERANIWVTRPAPGAENVQVQAVRPLRRVVVRDGDNELQLGIEVDLRRFEPGLEQAEVNVELAVTDEAGRVVGATRRQQSFAAGQGSATLSAFLPLEVSGQWGDSQMLTIAATVDAEPLPNRLAADDTGRAVVEVRRRFEVGVVEGATLAGEVEGLAAAQWMTLALAPWDDLDAGAIRPRLVEPDALAADDGELLDELDTVIILRPGAIDAAQWDVLAGFVRDGGLVWVWPAATEGGGAWAPAMIEAMDVDWRIGMEVEISEDEPGWRLAGDAPAPDPLEMLGSEWSELQRPVRVRGRLPLTAGQGERWLELAEIEPDDGNTLLAGTQLGAGHLLFSAVALDTRWTNLPTRPIFVPLVHEAVRGVLGQGHGRVVPGTVAGDAPTLARPWAQAEALQWLDEEGQIDDASPHPIPLRELSDPEDDGTDPDEPAGWRQPARELQRVGIWGPADGAGGLRLAVNPDADAGDTREVTEEELAQWLGGLGEWTFISPDQPPAIFDRGDERVSLGWPLLWIVLALILTETWLARKFSHAGVGA